MPPVNLIIYTLSLSSSHSKTTVCDRPQAQKGENLTVESSNRVKCCMHAPVGRQRRGKQLWGVCDVVVVGAAYRLTAWGGRGRSLHADLLQTLVLKARKTAEEQMIRKTVK